MVDACREMAFHHSVGCPELAHIYRREGFSPESLRTEEDLARLPSINVHGMKYHLLLSRHEDTAVLRLTSSGTGGQKTQAWMDQPSLDRAQAMLDTLWKQEGLVSDRPTHYVMFVYDPDQAKDLGIAFSAKNRQRFAPVLTSTYAIRKDASDRWAFEKDRIIDHLAQFDGGADPVRLIGITAFLHELVTELAERDIRLKLPSGSFLFTTGGWKAAEAKRVTREEFRRLAARQLNLPESQMRDGYGMAEHGAPYWECREHRMHVPVYARVFVRDPVTLAMLPRGQVGVMQLITPYNGMMPSLSVLTTDLGAIDADDCGCGQASPTFRILGRGGLSKHKGCAIHASEIVRRGA
jgi:phenylacetate-coenzyme A ligase PaaK-like adenylate-forming protein